MLLESLRPAAAGLILGLLGGGLRAHLIQTVRLGVRKPAALAHARVAVVVAMIAGFCCVFPAWRAAQLDPMVALRNP
jgi:ABC-type antimicrobial peptide transport system permease subunit